MNATIVFAKTWNAISESYVDDNGNVVFQIDEATGNYLQDSEGRPVPEKKYRYIIHEGSSRSSKTYSLIQLFWLYGHKNPGSRLSVWRDTKKDCKETVLPDMKKAFRNMDGYDQVVFNKTESYFLLPDVIHPDKEGSKIEIQGSDDENKVIGLEGQVLWVNEPYKMSKTTFDQLDMRTTDFVVIDWNPKQSHWIDDLKKHPRALVIKSTFRDNPFCPPEQRKKILGYQPVSMTDVVISGIIDENSALVYDMSLNKLRFTDKQLKELARCRMNEETKTANKFNWEVYGLGNKAEKPNRIFKWNEIPLTDYQKIPGKRYIGVDWGKVDPWGIIEAKWYDGCLYLRELNYDSENVLKSKLTPAEISQIEATEEGIVKWLFVRLAISKDIDIVCDYNRPQKIKALRHAGYERAIAAIKGAGSIEDGIDGLDKIKVFFTSDSTNIKYEQENYSRVVDRYGVIEDKAEDANNHTIDPTRYILSWLQKLGLVKTI